MLFYYETDSGTSDKYSTDCTGPTGLPPSTSAVIGFERVTKTEKILDKTIAAIVGYDIIVSQIGRNCYYYCITN